MPVSHVARYHCHFYLRPRVGGDLPISPIWALRCQFLLTPPRGGRHRQHGSAVRGKNFYSRPRVGGDPEFDSIVVELRETMAAIYQVIYSGAKRERPDTGMSKRSKGCGLVKSTSVYLDYNTDPQRVARPNFTRRGGVSL